MNIVDCIKHNKLIAIARKVPIEDIEDTATALYRGGIRVIEVTFDQSSDCCIENTTKSIRIIKEKLEGKMIVGAGTVLTETQVKAAHEAGADFILSPDVNVPIIRKVKSLGMVSIPGALTPTEIMTAYNAGADIIKLFPAGVLGISYIKAIKGPIGHIPLMAVGGIDSDNVGQFISSGYTSCGIGSNLVRNDLIQKGKFELITKIAESYLSAI